MIEIFSKALNETIKVDRIIGKLVGKEAGPTVVYYEEFMAMKQQEYLH